MRLRRLELGDSVRMLEWMQDADIVENLYTDFRDKTIEDCREFIRLSWENQNGFYRTGCVPGCLAKRYPNQRGLVWYAWENKQLLNLDSGS